MEQQDPRLGTDYAKPQRMEDDEARRAREIRTDIEQTREELSETVTAIHDRLRPANIASRAADGVRSAASERARDVNDSQAMRYMRANPVPATMVGIGVMGLAWLAFRGQQPDRRDGTFDYDHPRYSRWLDETGYTAGGMSAGDVGNPGLAIAEAGEAEYRSASYARSAEMTGTSGSAATRMRRMAPRAQRQLKRTWNERPLVMGAAAAVAGMLVGLSVPESEREHELMGSTRDNVVGNVQRAVGDKVSQVQEAATSAVDQVRETARTVVGLTGGKDT